MKKYLSLTLIVLSALSVMADDLEIIKCEFKKSAKIGKVWEQLKEPAFLPAGMIAPTPAGLKFQANSETLTMMKTIKKYPAKAGDVFEFDIDVKELAPAAGTWLYFRVITYKGNSYVNICQERINIRKIGDVTTKITVNADGKNFDFAVFAFGVEKGGTVVIEDIEVKKIIPEK